MAHGKKNGRKNVCNVVVLFFLSRTGHLGNDVFSRREKYFENKFVGFFPFFAPSLSSQTSSCPRGATLTAWLYYYYYYHRPKIRGISRAAYDTIITRGPKRSRLRSVRAAGPSGNAVTRARALRDFCVTYGRGEG